MNNLLKFITHSSLFISLCAASLSYYYSKITKTDVNPYAIIVIFFGTLLSYIGVQIIPVKNKRVYTQRNLWIIHNKNLLYSFMAISTVIIALSMQFLTFFELINLSHLFIIVLFYENISNRKFFNRSIELRRMPYLKPFLIAYVWSCVCCAPQVFTSQTSGNFLDFSAMNLVIWLESYFFILSLTIPFDIRDIEYDKEDGIKTLATRFPIKAIKSTSFIIFLVAQLLQFLYLESTLINLAISLFMIFTYLYALSRAFPNQEEKYFLIMLDGIILLKLLFLASL